MSRGARSQRRSLFRIRLEYWAALGLMGIGRILSWERGQRLGAWLGGLAFDLLARRRGVALQNLRRAFRGEKNEAEIRGIARRSVENVGRSVMELSWLDGATPRDLQERIAFENPEIPRDAMKDGRGALFLASHFGNWELMALAFAAAGFRARVVARRLDNPLLDNVLNQRRRRFGSDVIESRDPSALRSILTGLRNGEAIGVLIDQTVTGDRGVFVDFFGRVAYTHKVLALIALKTGAPVIPAFLFRLPDGRHRFRFEPPILLEAGKDREAAVLEATQRMTREIERKIREAPDHWLWIHDRWKKRPAPGRPAVFLDRDGTVSEEVGYIRRVEDLALIPGSAAAVRRLSAAGFATVLTTNQSGVARGYYPESFVEEVNQRLEADLRKEGAKLDRVYTCPHHPTEGTGSFTRACGCRKPEPGMILAAVRDLGIDPDRSFVVGDKGVDVQMARRVGARAVLVQTGFGPSELRKSGAAPDYVARDLADAAEWILQQTSTGESVNRGLGDGS